MSCTWVNQSVYKTMVVLRKSHFCNYNHWSAIIFLILIVPIYVFSSPVIKFDRKYVDHGLYQIQSKPDYSPRTLFSNSPGFVDNLLIWITTAGALLGTTLLLIIGLAASQLTEEVHHTMQLEDVPGILRHPKRFPREQIIHVHADMLESSEEEKEKSSKEENKEKAAKSLALTKEIIGVNAGSLLLAAHKIEFWYLISRILRRLFPGVVRTDTVINSKLHNPSQHFFTQINTILKPFTYHSISGNLTA